MMERWPIATGVTLSVFIGTLVWLSSLFDSNREPSNPEEMIALAIAQDQSEILEFLPFEDEDGTIVESLDVCISSDNAVDFQALTEAMKSRKLVPFSLEDCTFEREEGHGMFVYFDYYSAPNGEPAVELEVRYSCSAANRCSVEVDRPTGGRVYHLKIEGGAWHLYDWRTRWVV